MAYYTWAALCPQLNTSFIGRISYFIHMIRPSWMSISVRQWLVDHSKLHSDWCSSLAALRILRSINLMLEICRHPDSALNFDMWSYEDPCGSWNRKLTFGDSWIGLSQAVCSTCCPNSRNKGISNYCKILTVFKSIFTARIARMYRFCLVCVCVCVCVRPGRVSVRGFLPYPYPPTHTPLWRRLCDPALSWF